jgi:hypothetical protein
LEKQGEKGRSHIGRKVTCGVEVRSERLRETMGQSHRAVRHKSRFCTPHLHPSTEHIAEAHRPTTRNAPTGKRERETMTNRRS